MYAVTVETRTLISTKIFAILHKAEIISYIKNSRLHCVVVLFLPRSANISINWLSENDHSYPLHLTLFYVGSLIMHFTRGEGQNALLPNSKKGRKGNTKFGMRVSKLYLDLT